MCCIVVLCVVVSCVVCPGSGTGTSCYAPPMAMTTMGAPFKMADYNPMLDPWQGDQAFPMPRGIDSLEQWGRVVCKMEGHRDIDVRGKTFSMLLNESYTNPKMKKYLVFICTKFKHAISDQPESQGPDLAAFCLRCHFNVDEDGGKKGYVREFGKLASNKRISMGVATLLQMSYVAGYRSMMVAI